ncbi:MAG TPA: PDZ domain-containing protein [Vicinamibacterales bacterium]|nr:PDZ domain-containing protein [Vicinamibacterales bacterium]
MKLVKIFGVLVTLAGVGVLAMVLAPSVFGQERPERRSRELTVLAGRGAEIGVYVRDESAGVTVDEVRSDSAAEKAGLRANDVIVEFDGEHVRSARQFSRLVQETAVGRTVKTTILRDKQKKEIEITIPENHRADLFIDSDRFRDQLGDLGDRLGRLPFNFDFNFDFPEAASGRRLGVQVQEMGDQLSSYFGAKQGVLVTAVTEGSAASRAGLKAGDVITSINGTPVHSREDLTRELRNAKDDAVGIGIVRDKKESTVTATVEQPRRRTIVRGDRI